MWGGEGGAIEGMALPTEVVLDFHPGGRFFMVPIKFDTIMHQDKSLQFGLVVLGLGDKQVGIFPKHECLADESPHLMDVDVLVGGIGIPVLVGQSIYQLQLLE